MEPHDPSPLTVGLAYTRDQGEIMIVSQKKQNALKFPWQSGDTHQGTPSITDT